MIKLTNDQINKLFFVISIIIIIINNNNNNNNNYYIYICLLHDYMMSHVE